jgi:hypothetical protein
VANDLDCPTCQAGCTTALIRNVAGSLTVVSSSEITHYFAHFASPPFEPLERPPWRVLA